MKNHRIGRILKKIAHIILLVTSYWLLVTCCYAEDAVSSTELINNAKQYDGKRVIYKGEIIGDIMVRKGFAWINVNDGTNAIGVWSNKDLVKDILYTGSYKFRGDIIEVKGIFHRACLEHGGDLDIHAETFDRIESGAILKENLDICKGKIALILLGVLGVAAILSRLKIKSRGNISKQK